ncbi:hypothetical protein [Aureivirga sp. CE67]|uniref:hypothetical protein n=1 Tax=Aureivirga sp. CE67 TaxID=1788983 RepID=UPI0018CBAFF7|nr:hypothetical protein [Aureivirga sp. CE67]
MKNKITIDQAIKKGFYQVNVTSSIIGIITFILVSIFINTNNLPEWTYIIGGFLTIFNSLLYYYFIITKWKIWAFSNIDNIKELEEKALKHKIIPKRGSFSEKLEIKTKKEKLILENLIRNKEKIKKHPIEVNEKAPLETKIYFAKSNIYLIPVIVCIVILNFISNLNYSFILKVILSSSSVLGLISIIYYRKLKFDSSVQIIINDKGIFIKEYDFFSWDKIKQIETKDIGDTDTSIEVLYIYIKGYNKITIDLDKYNTSSYTLEFVIENSRKRFYLNKKAS